MKTVSNNQIHTLPVDSFARKYNALCASGLQDE